MSLPISLSSGAGLRANRLDPHALALVETELALRRKKIEATRRSLLPYQERPSGAWANWLLLGGRGAGKTYAGAYHTIEHLRAFGANAWPTIIAPTLGDARAVCLEGPSGIYTLFREEFLEYNRTHLTLRHKNGGLLKAFGAEKPDRLRGPQSSWLWIDELAVIDEETLSNAFLGLRLGENPQALLTTTPRPTAFIKKMIADKRTVVSKATTFENTFLSARALEEFEGRFGGTRLGRQELLAEILDEVEGALWSSTILDATRVREIPVEIARTVVAIDPATTRKKSSDETGVAVVSKGIDGEYYVRYVEGFRVTPSMWARRAIDLFNEFEADVIIGEVNNGGDMVEETIRAEWADVPFKDIHATKGKRLRAEPVSLLYEKGKVHHVGSFPALEDQMINFGYSIEPEHDDRLDAVVYAITELMGEDKPLLIGRVGHGMARK